MVSKKVTIKNPTGLHLRPAGELCKTAMQLKQRSHSLLKEALLMQKMCIECTWSLCQKRR